MAGKLVIVGRRPALDAQLTFNNQLQLGLFTNNITILDTTVLADLTEAAWSGYLRLTPATFGAAFLDSSNVAVTQAAAQAFNNTSGSTVTFRGYFLFDPTSTNLVYAENLGGDVPIVSGAAVLLVPSITDTTAA